MPDNEWEWQPSQGFVGWVMNYTAAPIPLFRGYYRLSAQTRVLQRLHPDSNVWTRWDVAPVPIQVTVLRLTTPGSVPWTVTMPPNNIGPVTMASNDGTHFTVPWQGLTMDHGAPEYSYYTFRCGNTFAPTGTNLIDDQPFDPGRSIRLCLGSQAAGDEHAGFGLFHIMKIRGRAVQWSYEVLVGVIRGLLSGTPYVVSRNGNHGREWWLVSSEATRGLSGVKKDRSVQRWQLVLREGQGYYLIQTLITKQNSEQYRQEVGIV